MLLGVSDIMRLCSMLSRHLSEEIPPHFATASYYLTPFGDDDEPGADVGHPGCPKQCPSKCNSTKHILLHALINIVNVTLSHKFLGLPADS